MGRNKIPTPQLVGEYQMYQIVNATVLLYHPAHVYWDTCLDSEMV